MGRFTYDGKSKFSIPLIRHKMYEISIDTYLIGIVFLSMAEGTCK